MEAVKFIKDHPLGIKVGAEHQVTKAHAQRLAEGGYIKYDGAPEKPVSAKPEKPAKPAKQSK